MVKEQQVELSLIHILGLLAGIFLFTRALDLLMTRYPRATYLVILGFMLASLPTLLPGLPGAAEWLPCLLSCLLYTSRCV